MMVGVLAMFIVGVTIAIVNDRPLVAVGIIVLGYIAIVIQNQPELVFGSGRCLRCGYECEAATCPECGWMDLQR